jgi:hypothetical protein
MESNWISVKDRLPLEKNKHWNVIGEYIVTVELDDGHRDPNDDPEVMMLWFDANKQIWFDFETWKEYNWGWNVTHWQEKPEPAN